MPMTFAVYSGLNGGDGYTPGGMNVGMLPSPLTKCSLPKMRLYVAGLVSVVLAYRSPLMGESYVQVCGDAAQAG